MDSWKGIHAPNYRWTTRALEYHPLGTTWKNVHGVPTTFRLDQCGSADLDWPNSILYHQLFFSHAPHIRCLWSNPRWPIGVISWPCRKAFEASSQDTLQEPHERESEECLPHTRLQRTGTREWSKGCQSAPTRLWHPEVSYRHENRYHLCRFAV